MRQSGDYPDDKPLTLPGLKEFLNAAIDGIDIDSLKADVLPFVRDPQSLDLWSKDFFREIVSLIKAG
jgi:hypothetical protein